MDIGSAVGRENGLREEQLMELPRYESSGAFDDVERLVLDLAVAMAKTPADIPAVLLERLHARFSETQLVELAAAIAWEHYRARFNRVFGVRPAGFSEGAFCVLPERKTTAP
jgi:alkylhydroperoxidase family enzyme